jgi:hypothetical protein
MRLIFAFLLTFISFAHAHEHKPGETSEQARVVEFLRKWQRPKGNFGIVHRQGSCCYSTGEHQDCFPVKQVRVRNGVTEILPDTDDASTTAQANYSRWFPLTTGVEEDKQPDPRESPDGRSYVCIAGAQIICFVNGTGM